MNTNLNQQNNRIVVVDVLRGFALFGILLLHALEHFDFYWNIQKNPEFFKPFDPYFNDITRFLFSGKSYSIFALMFGFSFFIQIDRNQQRGVDFRGKFLWRLTILFVFGYFHSLLYMGDILTIYAIMGLPLILLLRFNNKVLFVFAILLIFQIPTIFNLIHTFINPEFTLPKRFNVGLYSEAFNNMAHGSFWDVFRFNTWKGHVAVIGWTYYNGRYLQLFGLFTIGLIIGRKRIFENIETHKKKIFITQITCLISFVVFYIMFLKIPNTDFSDISKGLSRKLLKSWSDILFTGFSVSTIILLYLLLKNRISFNGLASYGRMSLSNYLLQPLIGVWIFYNYGIGFYNYCGPTLSILYGLTFFILQIIFSKIWLKHFYYGPLEWLWRALTYMNFKVKFRRNKEKKVVR